MNHSSWEMVTIVLHIFALMYRVEVIKEAAPPKYYTVKCSQKTCCEISLRQRDAYHLSSEANIWISASLFLIRLLEINFELIVFLSWFSLTQNAPPTPKNPRYADKANSWAPFTNMD